MARLPNAATDIENLLETQSAIISDLPNYIEKERLRLSHLENQLQILKKEHEEALKDVSYYLENPLNMFKLIKRLSHDLRSFGESPDSDAEYIKYLNTTSPQLAIPNREDLIGAALALVRLQNTYKLNVTELADGRLKDAYSSPMTSEDCFVIGRIIYINEVDTTCEDALPWFQEALRKYQDGDKGHLSQVEILEYIAYSHYKLGNLESAIDWSFKILSLEPDNKKILKNVYHYFNRVVKDNETLHIKGDTGEALPEAAIVATVDNPASSGLYEALCRGEFQLDRAITKRLFCWYSSKQHPFLLLAPIKVEQVYIEPDVFVFHQVISDDEIQQVKDIARPRFGRALVISVNGTEPKPALYRISKSSWLADDESPVVARITQRLADMTGLMMNSAEDLQVANYGIGGHYAPHLDYSVTPEKAFRDRTNRIATVLFYMSEVAQGGATVFTELGLSVFPIKNAALYWLNLHPSGEGDRATRHAACPVLRGSKWVSNKWIHQRGQELIRPCNLEFQPESMVRTIPSPLPKTFR